MKSVPRITRIASGLALALFLVLPAFSLAAPREDASLAASESVRARPNAATSVVLQNSRMRVSITWRNQYNGKTGQAFVIPQTDEFAYFYFSDPGNPEVFVKVLDFGEPSPFLAFYSGLTDFEYTVTFESLCNAKRLTITKPAGSYEGGGDNRTLTWCSGGGTGTRPVPNFTFSPASPAVGDAVTFTNTSANALTYYWDFADGETSTEENPVKTFRGAGIYSVQLVAYNTYGNNSIKKPVEVRPPQAAPMRVNISNTLVQGVEVTADGNAMGTIPTGETRGFDITSSKTQVRVEVETVPVEYPAGGVIPGSKTLYQFWDLGVFAGTVVNLETSAYFQATNESFYAPLLTNSTSVALVPVANHVDFTEFACPCTIPPAARDAYIGYYPLYPISRFSVFRENGYPSGPYKYWQSFSTFWSPRSGAVLFNATVPPATNPGGEQIEMLPAPPKTNSPDEPEAALPDGGGLRSFRYRGPYALTPLPEIPIR